MPFIYTKIKEGGFYHKKCEDSLCKRPVCLECSTIYCCLCAQNRGLKPEFICVSDYQQDRLI